MKTLFSILILACGLAAQDQMTVPRPGISADVTVPPKQAETSVPATAQQVKDLTAVIAARDQRIAQLTAQLQATQSLYNHCFGDLVLSIAAANPGGK